MPPAISSFALALAAATLALGACGGTEPPSRAAGRAGIPATIEDAGAPADAAPRPIDAGPPLGETEARLLAADRFRRAGLRIRQDVRVIRTGLYDLTLDGWDPEQRVGYEYIAPEEAGLDLDGPELAELARDSTLRVLILDRTDRPTTTALIEAFLADLIGADAGQP